MILKDCPKQSKEIAVYEALAAFQEIHVKTFSNTLGVNWKESVEKFQQSYLKIIPTACKSHSIFVHLIPYIEKVGRGLSLDSEHSLEACHFQFKKWLKRYNLPEDKSRDSYSELALRAVVDFNRTNMV